jgi:denticleless
MICAVDELQVENLTEVFFFFSFPVAVFVGHQNSTFYVKSCLSPDGLYLASGSSDECAYIWNTCGSGRPVTSLVGHGAEVTCVQWCPTGDTKVSVRVELSPWKAPI